MNDDNSQTQQQTAPQTEIDMLAARITELEAQLAAQKEAVLMARADLDNHRKRTEAEKAKFGVMHNMQLVMQILEVIDDINLALQDQNLDVEHAKHMLEVSQSKLNGALTIAGLESVPVKTGDKFDATKMEAVTTVPVDEKDKDNKVVSVINSAYKYSNNNEYLKMAKVVVGKSN